MRHENVYLRWVEECRVGGSSDIQGLDVNGGRVDERMVGGEKAAS